MKIKPIMSYGIDLMIEANIAIMFHACSQYNVSFFSFFFFFYILHTKIKMMQAKETTDI